MNPLDEAIEKLRLARDEFGWAVVSGPLPPTNIFPISYSAGATLPPLQHPELAVTGLPPQVTYLMLTAVFDQVRDGARFAVGDVTVLEHKHTGEEWCVAFGSVASRVRTFMHIADRFAPDGFDALQIVWADPSDLLPWDDGYDKRFAQPLLD